MKSNGSQAIFLGIISALFFAVTFVLNRLMSVEGGGWVWSASFRFFWMVPILLIIVAGRKKMKALIVEMRLNLWKWILWSTIGFGIFYAAITFSAKYSPSWLVASTWQITIIAGMLMAPFINKPKIIVSISKRSLFFSLIILFGIALMQINQAQSIPVKEFALGTLPILLAAFAYPLGNRKMMQITNGKLDALQRTLGMTLASLPFWFLLAIYGIVKEPMPTSYQISQTLIVAICSGVIATALFFMATDIARNNEKLLASVEATQSTEVLFTLIGEIIILHVLLPDLSSILGIGLIILGMVLHSVGIKKE